MSEPLPASQQQQTNPENVIFNSEIQSSAHLNSQYVISASFPASPTAIGPGKKSSSRSRLGISEEFGDGGGVGAVYEGEMERFFQSEVKPVYFGGKNDAYLLLKVTVIASLLVNLFGVLVYMQYDNKIPHNPSVRQPHGLLKLLSALESAFSAYCSDGQIVVGWMLGCWFLGYNLISGVIWWQFERRETRTPDDYEIIPSFRMRRRTGGQHNNNPTNTGNSSVLNDPSVSRDSFKRSSLSRSHQKQQQADEQNPYDKSVIVISMPNGDFSVGKRQK